MTSVVERLRGESPKFSVEFLPPRDAEDEKVLWKAVRELEGLDPAFVSITYGAGGSRRDRTIRATGRIAQETTLLPVAHLTAVEHSVAELRNVIGWYAAIGVRNILALRGDPPGDPMGEWVAHPEGLNYADELVRLVRELGDFCVGVAAFPYGHPRSGDLDTDLKFLLRKLDAGADYAVAQLFHAPEPFLRMRDRVAAAGCSAAILPGIMPMLSPRGLAKIVELSGADLPLDVSRRLEPYLDDAVGFRAAGIDIATEMCQRLLDEGVPALHFYTMNRSKATKEVLGRLGLVTRA
ncbi:methylenetetrahydrofolate reductase [Lentzea flaviverrucosa]|jgi:methylenetetrahydrofolate reductase (NADPH)|uniref:Methylenetetrahydrofolate reductase n=1 Tax=Lentzea flaviverrucosa TaxID=200379 RepID=A0A1H9XWP5_9PSEU|nr:methylenetetrahydrofolate reductase [Lentzea flaviverrucosa]RDI17524.1 5,10-methylenetetrahydrofolate reductase (NAD(P)) [Lentzea flaviverrucosa]SES50608.1 methylenetetrahydrofolate reductase (NADPH) [Lentzea flaviverrucosa]